jgi:hypothetical protein
MKGGLKILVNPSVIHLLRLDFLSIIEPGFICAKSREKEKKKKKKTDFDFSQNIYGNFLKAVLIDCLVQKAILSCMFVFLLRSSPSYPKAM